jgi:hypothetical protein
MTQGKRFGLSAVRKRDMWRRWKAGRSLHEIGRAFGKAFVDSLFGVASWWVPSPRSGGARSERLHWASERTSLAGVLPVSRFVR